MITTEQTTQPAWLNLDAIHPPEELAKLPAMIDAARGVLEAVADFNRNHLDEMRAYYRRNDAGPDDLQQVDELTGMDQVDGYLSLAAHVLEATVVGDGMPTDGHAVDLADRYADTVTGVRSIYNRREGTFPQVKS